MNNNTRLMLGALRNSLNVNTREHAIDILENRKIAFDTQGLGAEELAATGHLGGFLQAVMSGSFREAWARADTLNREAIMYVETSEDTEPEE